MNTIFGLDALALNAESWRASNRSAIAAWWPAPPGIRLRIHDGLVTHELRERRFDGLRPCLRSGGAGVEQIPHQVGVDRAVGPQEDVVDVEPEHVLSIGQLAVSSPARRASRSLGRGVESRAGCWPLARHRRPSGKMRRIRILVFGWRLRIRSTMALVPAKISSAYAPAGNAGCRVVGANEDHDHFRRLGEFEFAVLQVPQDLLGAIAIMAEVDRVARGEMLAPTRP